MDSFIMISHERYCRSLGFWVRDALRCRRLEPEIELGTRPGVIRLINNIKINL